MKTRFVFSAFCMLVAMTMATGAFAQGTFQVSSRRHAGPDERPHGGGRRYHAGAHKRRGIAMVPTIMGRCSSITASRSRMQLMRHQWTDNNIVVDICGDLGMTQIRK